MQHLSATRWLPSQFCNCSQAAQPWQIGLKEKLSAPSFLCTIWPLFKSPFPSIYSFSKWVANRLVIIQIISLTESGYRLCSSEETCCSNTTIKHTTLLHTETGETHTHTHTCIHQVFNKDPRWPLPGLLLLQPRSSSHLTFLRVAL